MTSTQADYAGPRLKLRYRDEVASALREQFGYRNVMQVPGVVKVVGSAPR